MRVQSNYGNTAFDTRGQVLSSQKTMRKLFVYLILTSFSIYIGKVVLNLNLTIINDVFHKIINGESVNFDSSYFLEVAKRNEVVAYLFSIYYFFERSFFVIRDYLYLIGEKFISIGKNFLAIIK